MNKQKLQNKLKEQQLSIIADIKEKIDTMGTMNDIDESDTIDPEDFSHQTESGELKVLFEQKLKKAEADLETINKIDFSEKKIAETGALVSTEKFHFFLGLALVPFEFDNKKIVGVSTESSIFPIIKGKSVGDHFTHSDNHYTILEIH